MDAKRLTDALQLFAGAGDMKCHLNDKGHVVQAVAREGDTAFGMMVDSELFIITVTKKSW